MTVYAIPSFAVIIIKAWLLWRGRSRAQENSALMLLFCALLALNLVEFSMFMLSDTPQAIAWLMHLYYCCATFSAAAVLNLFLHLTGNSSNQLTTINWALATAGAALTLIPGVVIAGVENIGYTFIRLPGNAYIGWAVYAASTLIFSLVVLLRGYQRNIDATQRRRCLAVLIGLLPGISSAIGIIFLMLAGVKINATIVLSSTLVFFLVALIYSEQRYGLFKLLARVPFTEEYALRSALANQVKNIELNAFGDGDQPSFKAQMRKIESLYVDLAIVANGGNKTHAAAALGISNATLHRKTTLKRQQAGEKSEANKNTSHTRPWTPASRCSTLDK